MAYTYLIEMKDVIDGKVQPDSIEPKYILVAATRFSPEKFMEGVNFMAKFGWRPVGYVKEEWILQCLMERTE
jgi:hypothetical protein